MRMDEFAGIGLLHVPLTRPIPSNFFPLNGLPRIRKTRFLKKRRSSKSRTKSRFLGSPRSVRRHSSRRTGRTASTRSPDGGDGPAGSDDPPPLGFGSPSLVPHLPLQIQSAPQRRSVSKPAFCPRLPNLARFSISIFPG